ncbi:hypothetical protein B0H17DRAFT_1136490 [Mycena rosella]|uniref:Uncharacterized protein n=1 Tax=Mycena rosella TaxID=1033263 RepID=A0AAD7DCG3_MYCRO|nr:hypothetical protein B0H17DRAFT_1136490 [Mycena rosella]
MRFTSTAAALCVLFFLSSAVLGQGDVVGRDVESDNHKSICHAAQTLPTAPPTAAPAAAMPSLWHPAGESDIACPLAPARRVDVGYGDDGSGGKNDHEKGKKAGGHHKDGGGHGGKGHGEHGNGGGKGYPRGDGGYGDGKGKDHGKGDGKNHNKGGKTGKRITVKEEATARAKAAGAGMDGNPVLDAALFG